MESLLWKWCCQLSPRAKRRCGHLKQLHMRSCLIQQSLCPKSLLRQRASITSTSVKRALKAQCPILVPSKPQFHKQYLSKGTLLDACLVSFLVLIWLMQQESLELPGTEQQSIWLMESRKESIPVFKTCGSQTVPLLTTVQSFRFYS